VAISLAGAAVGGRFAPRYFDQVLPGLVICAARGCVLLAGSRLAVAALAVAMAIPAIRFGPRYVLLASDDLRGSPHFWRDVAMDQESRQVAQLLSRVSQPGDTIFIWGYRPNVIVYTRQLVASRLWDSQPLTGVPADRHLTDARPVDETWARQLRAELARTKPAILVDGLSAYNPQLDIRSYPDLAAWLQQYCLVAATGGTSIYRLCSSL
jgi:hypothetical protein